MKLLFICRTLEAGKCGVGDYVQRLAFDLVEKGHGISLLSFNDPYIADKYDSVLNTEAGPMKVLRIPEKTATRTKMDESKKWIDETDPEYISLQYVPYSFQIKGLPIRLASELSKIGGNRKWHIMFHELWIGMNRESSVKDRLIGYFQKKIVYRLHEKLNPSSVSTNTGLYVRQLENMGIRAEFLPLCSNIPVVKLEPDENIVPTTGKRKIRFVLFGEIQLGAPVEDFTKDVLEFTASENKVPVLVLLGRNGAKAGHWVKTWQSTGMEVEILGEQSESAISSSLMQCDFGITTTPLAQVDKSGTVVAMQNHGLPVICVARKWTPRGIENVENKAEVLEYARDGLKALLRNRAKVTVPKIEISELSNHFVSQLGHCPKQYREEPLRM